MCASEAANSIKSENQQQETEQRQATISIRQVTGILLALQKELSTRASISQALALLFTAEYGPISLMELSEKTSLSSSTLSRIMMVLGDRGRRGGKSGRELINIEEDETDFRKRIVSLTRYGRMFINSVFFS